MRLRESGNADSLSLCVCVCVDVALAYTIMVVVLDARKYTGSLFIITTFLTIPKLRRVFALQLVFFMAICELVNACGVMIGACVYANRRATARA